MKKLFASERSCIRTTLRGSPSTDEVPLSDLGTRSGFLSQPGWLTISLLSRALLGLLLVLMGSAAARADSLNVGVLSFDVLIPGAIDAFTVNNSTEVFKLPPDFPVLSALIFSSPTLTLTESGTPSPMSLADIGPGPFQQFVLDSATFSEADFSAQLSQTLFALADGTSFQASSNTLTATLLPSSGSFLTPGVDQVLLTVSGSVVATPVPEPSSWLLFAGAAPWFILFRGVIRRRHP
jgi:hypothetical protein